MWVYFISLFLFNFPASPVIVWRAFAESDKSSQPEEKPQKHTVTAKKRKVLTCVLRQSLRYYSPDLGRFVNIPGYSLDAIYASVSFFFSLFFIQSVEQTRTQVFLPPSLLQDRCERSWPSRSTCIPAVKPARRQNTRLLVLLFKLKTPTFMCIAGAFIVEVPVPRFLRPLLRVSGCVDASPPASTRIGDTAASAAVAAAPHWGGRPQRHAPLRLEKAISPWERETGGQCWMRCPKYSTSLWPDRQWGSQKCINRVVKDESECNYLA